MKVKCPKCNTIGFLEKRGNSYRIKHYKGYVNYRRKYIIRSLSQEDAFRMGINHQSEAKRTVREVDLRNPTEVEAFIFNI